VTTEDAILEFRNVNLVPHVYQHSAVSELAFTLKRSELMVVLLDPENTDMPLCDLAEGLVEPDSGTVLFCAESWTTMHPFRQGQLRGKIGRVFDGEGWVSNLTVYENMVLALRHHTHRSETDIRHEVKELSDAAGVLSFWDRRPDAVPRAALQRAQWVRAFAGSHILFLLERPEREVAVEQMPVLFELVRKAVADGSSVLWTTLDREVWNTGGLGTCRRAMIRDGKMEEK